MANTPTVFFTHQTVHDLIQRQYESDLPDRVLHALRPLDGKPITTRLLAKMPELPGGAYWRLIRHYGWTSLETSTYSTPAGYSSGTSLSLILARSEASVPLDTAFVEEHNTAYYSGRRERNHARMEAMNTKATLDACADVMNKAQSAIAALRTVAAHLEALTEYGTTLNPDRYEIERACGLYYVDLDRKR